MSDLWPKSAVELGIIKNNSIINLTQLFEEFVYKNSDMITGQTNGIVEDIKLRVKNKKIFWYPNSHDFENKIDSQIPYSNENIENLHRKILSICFMLVSLA